MIRAGFIGLFERETRGSADRAVLLGSADRLLELLGHPRDLAEGRVG
jgi:hypothetical protein